MKYSQETVIVMWLSLTSIVFLSCVSSTLSSWGKKDGIKIEVPVRMANILKRITKHKLNSISGKSTSLRQFLSLDGVDIGTVLKRMHLHGLKKVAGKMDTDLRLPNKIERTLLQRQKRSVSQGKPSTAKICNGGKIYVNLTKYSNIVAPIGFTTQYCGKWYPVPISNDPVTQIVSQAILDTFSKMKTFSKLVFGNSKCCAPSKSKDLVVLYNDPVKHYSMIKYVKKVIVRSCGCPTS